MHLALIGLMGSGKTTVGKRLALSLECPFYDTDTYLEQQTGFTIRELFERHGEEGFRNLESEALQTLLKQPAGVLATGGGIVLKAINRQNLRRSAWLVYLKTHPRVLAQRLQGVKDRPLLTEENAEWSLQSLLNERSRFYEECDWVAETDKRNPAQVAAHIRSVFLPNRKSPFKLRVKPSASSAYNLYVAPDILSHCQEILKKTLPAKHDFILTHSRLRGYADALAKSREMSGARVTVFEVPPGEKSKSLYWAQKAYQALAQAGAYRTTTLFSVGGGVIGDLGGFVAATYMRGVPFVQVPTSLLAQVDSSIGGKVGVDLSIGKNLVGAFYQPKAVLMDTETLQSLPERHKRNGFAEILKYGIALNRGLWHRLQAFIQQGVVDQRRIKLTERDWVPLIAGCAWTKAMIVAADERDVTGQRAVLNFGHTVGHAIEFALGYKGWLHGEAVAVGMIVEAEIGRRLGITPPELVEELTETIRAYRLPSRQPSVSPEALMAAMRMDKKNEEGKFNMVLLKGIGEAELTRDVSETLIQEAIWQCARS